jgi:hypothetical protein
MPGKPRRRRKSMSASLNLFETWPAGGAPDGIALRTEAVTIRTDAKTVKGSCLISASDSENVFCVNLSENVMVFSLKDIRAVANWSSAVSQNIKEDVSQ